ncbi:MAG: ribonuclease P protein component [Acidimicrobiales bacterium]|nr:ribonuclease P protein component [Acidimicrobiales bacterium]
MTQGTPARSGPVRLRYLARTGTVDPDPVEATPRIGYAVTRSVGTAVVRNRQRRRLREVFAALDRHGELPPGDYLVALRPEGATNSFKELESHVHNALQKLSLR